MKIALDWLSEYIDISDLTAAQVAEKLTFCGLEVEDLSTWESVPGGLKGVVVGQVLTCTKHPNADKLSLTTVDVGEGEPLPIVCGAPNVAAGQKVLVATVGTELKPTGATEPFHIKKAKIRGEASQGMICAEDELGLGTSHQGIMVLDTDLPNGTPAKEYLGFTESTVLEVAITPNRVDGASHIGAARDLRAVLQRQLCWPGVDGFAVDDQALPISVKVEAPEACPRYAGLSLTNVTVGPSPQWLQDRLRAVGQSPINNVVDATNYVLQELGQPMHAFDAAAIAGQQVRVKKLAAGTAFTTLDGEERKLQAHDLMICNGADQGMCIAGVFGGAESGVKESTTEVFLESAYFDPDHVRRTSLEHGLKTEAAFRYERGADPDICVYALKRCALLLKEIAGATISSDVVDVYPQPIAPKQVACSWSRLRRIVGQELAKENLVRILTDLDIKVLSDDGESFTVSVPAYRVDVTREQDVQEEILRIYGYNNISDDLGQGSDMFSPQLVPDREQLSERLSLTLMGAGFREVVTNSLTTSRYSEQATFVDPALDVTMHNPLSTDLSVMRQHLVFSMLEVAAHNLRHRQGDLRLFEYGRVYEQQDGARREADVLGLLTTGLSHGESWDFGNRRSSLAELKAVGERLLAAFAPGQLKTIAEAPAGCDYGVQLLSGKTVVATFGRLSDATAKLAEVGQEVFYGEVRVEALLSLKKSAVRYAEVPRFPEVRRDLSLVLDKAVRYAEVQAVAEKYSSHLLKRTNLFDIYEGDKLEPGQKAYALSFFLQDPKQTLSDKVIDKTMAKLMQGFEKELNAHIRS